MKIPILALILAPLAALAVERPLHWTSDISRVADMRFDAMHGDALDFKVDFNANGKPVDMTGLDATLYWQTNGMGSAWWSAPGAISNATARALFPSSADPGDKTLNFYLALSGGSNVVYGASARVTFRNSPGLSPNMIAPPIVTIDFNTIEVANAPWTEIGERATGNGERLDALEPQVATNAANIASLSSQLSQVPQSLDGKVDKDGDYITVSNAAKNAIQTIELGGQTLPRDLMSHDKVSIPVMAPSSDVSLIGTPADTYYTYIALFGKANSSDIPPAVSNVVTKAYVENLETDPTVPQWAKAAQKPPYTASEVGAYSTGDVDIILQEYLPLDYFKNSQTIPMYLGDGTKLCDFGANWLGILASTVSEKPDAADIPPAVSNTVTKAYVESLGISADFSTNNAELVETIAATSPAPGDYSTVSNRAMTALQSYTETDPTVPSWAKSQTQPLPPDYATVSNKAMTALQSYTETDPTVPAWAKNQTKPSYTASEVGVNDYANVSNKAMTALQSYTESDPTISSWAKGAQKPTYTASEVGAISKTGTTVTGSGALIKFVGYGMNPTTGGTAITLSSSSDANMTSYLYSGVAVKRNGTNSDYLWDTESPNGVVRRSEIDGMATSEELEASDRIIYAIVEGTNVLDVVTNYDSVVNIPERMLVQIDTNGERKVVWRESTRHNATIEQLTAALDNATNALATATAALLAAKADRAWGKYTSGLGEDAPADTLWISHPNTVLAGGLDWMKNVTTGGDIFVLTSNGMALEFENNPTNAAFFNLASNGETIFRIEKTDERAVYVNISDVDVVGNYLLVGFQSWAWPTHPLLRVKEDLADAEWLKEEDAVDGEWAGVARFAWSGDGVNVPFVVSVENLTGGSKIFAGFSYTAPGETKIIHNGVTDLSKGVFYNGKTYKPVVNGNKIELVEQQ